MKQILIAIAAISLISGCTTISPEKIAAGDAGPQPNPTEFITAHLQRDLVDPDSVKALKISEPIKCGKLTSSWRSIFGWCISYEYNAKNRMGGYTGLSTHQVMVREGKVIWQDGAFTEFQY